MGARLVVSFGDTSHIYLHWGGEYADQIHETMDAFFADVAELSDRRLDDMPYLAAKLVVWAANRGRMDGAHPLAFLGVGVVSSDDWGDAHVQVSNGGTWKIVRELGDRRVQA